MREQIIEAIGLGIDDVRQIGTSGTNARLIDEAQFQCSFYHHFNQNGYLAQTESPVIQWIPSNGENPGTGGLPQCDLVLYPKKKNGQKVWMELKVAGYALRGHSAWLHNNDKRDKWEQDVNKLSNPAIANDIRAFVLISFFDFDYSGENEPNRRNMFRERINAFIQENGLEDNDPGNDNPKTFDSLQWRGFALYPRAWIWVWGEDN
ncbi:MAG: hypothetical protein DRP56_04455 [Planctomycetota bacterium]|nr:MAG: hypothetical protein DRP56_04455 [Planctomycetota bacterium]